MHPSASVVLIASNGIIQAESSSESWTDIGYFQRKPRRGGGSSAASSILHNQRIQSVALLHAVHYWGKDSISNLYR